MGQPDSGALVFAGDEGATIGLVVAATSAVKMLSAAARPHLFVLDVGISEHSRGKLRTAISRVRPDIALGFLPVPQERLVGLPRAARFTAATYARLMVPERLPPCIGRAVYLDTDILVRRDLSPLLSFDLRGSPLGAVRDFLERPTRYFNAGVMVMDLERWRSQSVASRVFARAASSPPVPSDQEALNDVVPDWWELDYRWNVQHGNLFFAGMQGLMPRGERGEFTDGLVADRRRLYRNAAVLHWVGGVKPWQRLCPLPGTTAWLKTLVGSGWLSPRETVDWCLRYAWARGRYAFGTTRLQITPLARDIARRMSGRVNGVPDRDAEESGRGVVGQSELAAPRIGRHRPA